MALPAYDEYAARGESENRHQEFQCDLAMDRLSDHRFVANYFRLYLHAAAMNLLIRLRRFIAEPLPPRVPPAETAAPTVSSPGEVASLTSGTCLPAEALTGGGAAAALPLASAARPAGGRSPRHRAHAADQGGGGGGGEHAPCAGTAVVELAASGLVSSGVRALAWSRPDRSSPSLRLSLVTSHCGDAPVGGKGVVCLWAGQSRDAAQQVLRREP
jgi:hypothetical protein